MHRDLVAKPGEARLCLDVPGGRGGLSGLHQGETEVGQFYNDTRSFLFDNLPSFMQNFHLIKLGDESTFFSHISPFLRQLNFQTSQKLG